MDSKRPAQQQIVRPTGTGPVRLRSFCTPRQISTYRFDPQFTAHAQYRSLYTKRSSLERHAGNPDANVTLALSERDQIIGFAVLDRPDEDERWAQMRPGVMMEVKVVEVSRSWRRHHLAHDLMGMLLQHPRIESMIAYMVGYSWTWDLDGSGKTALEYRNLLIRLFAPFGFAELQTNEPNICLKPENLFMARIGARVSQQLQQEFKWLRFGIAP